MKSRILILCLIAILLVTCYNGCIENNDTKNGNGENKFTLEEVALLESEINNVEKLHEEYVEEQYYAENLTGNKIKWIIKEAYFAVFAGNTSRVTESLIRLESKEKVTQNMALYKPYLLTNDLTEQEMDTIGDTSFLLKGTMVINNNDTDAYILSFSMGDVIIALHGYGSDRNEIISYAKIIENKILDAI